MFNACEKETPPFKEHKECIFSEKGQHEIVRDSAKVHPFQMLKEELFNPQDSSNIETDFLPEELGSIVATTLLKEFTDTRKATHNHLSASDGRLSWGKATDEEKSAGLGIFTSNNASESAFRGLT